MTVEGAGFRVQGSGFRVQGEHRVALPRQRVHRPTLQIVGADLVVPGVGDQDQAGARARERDGCVERRGPLWFGIEG